MTAAVTKGAVISPRGQSRTRSVHTQAHVQMEESGSETQVLQDCPVVEAALRDTPETASCFAPWLP